MKILGIGLSRTGTQSLWRAMEILGFRSLHDPRDVVEIAGKCDFANDITVSWQFELLDKLFPGSKFIYTTREIESWLNSCEKHFNSAQRQQRLQEGYGNDQVAINAAYLQSELAIYGQEQFDREVWRNAYIKHDDRVNRYFIDRQSDLLRLDVFTTPSEVLWKTLMDFTTVTAIPFPHLNRS